MTIPDEPERWASIERAAVHMALSRATVYRLIAAGQITSTRVGRRRLVDLRSIDRLLEDPGSGGGARSDDHSGAVSAPEVPS